MADNFIAQTTSTADGVSQRETMNLVIVGHVDHGKSTLVGRLLADTGVLGEGKLEKVQATCKRQGKAFEYAFLLDALEAEQDQGITIDAARVFFRSERRDYILIDAPGHIEFLKNMVTGAARAQAAVLLIDAHEGVQENSRRHGYLLSMLGIRQVVVAVNKMDLVDYNQKVFASVVAEYTKFLAGLDITPQYFVPISARAGDFVASKTKALSWFDGPTILEAVDSFEKQRSLTDLPLRLPVQDVYKFNFKGDDRRMIAGRIETGTFRVGDRVLFSPSNKSSTVASIERFSAPETTTAVPGQSTAITLTEQIFVGRGEIMSHLDHTPGVSTLMRVNLFWLGREPMVPDKRYKLKLATGESEVTIDDFYRVLDASELDSNKQKRRIDRHDVADILLRSRKPMAFDPAAEIEATGRFVIVDGYDIAGGGIIREMVADAGQQRRLETKIRSLEWVRGDVTPTDRAALFGHPAFMLMFVGDDEPGKHEIAKHLESRLVRTDHRAYMLDGKNVFLGVDADMQLDDREELVRRYAEVAHVLLDAGLVVISTTHVIGVEDHEQICTQTAPFEVMMIGVGKLDPDTENGTRHDGVDFQFEGDINPAQGADEILRQLQERGRLRNDFAVRTTV